MTISERVAEERGEALGESVGYSVRFDSKFPRPYGSILYCTVGVLLRKLEKGLCGISHVIVDEIHERDVDTDFLLILLRDMNWAFPQIKIILMSATINVDLFSKYFGDLNTVEVSGRLHPVEQYFLEDVIEMTGLDPSHLQHYLNKSRKRKSGGSMAEDVNEEIDLDEEADDNEAEDDETGDGPNCNAICDESNYSSRTRQTMASISERSVPYELIDVSFFFLKQQQ